MADILSFSDLQSSDVVEKDGEEKGKDVNSDVTETPLMLFLKLLNTPLFLRSRLYIELVLLFWLFYLIKIYVSDILAFT